MLLMNLEDLRADAERMLSFRNENEQGYLYLMKYYALTGNSEGIRKVIRMTEQRNLYLSAEGRAEIAFWQS